MKKSTMKIGMNLGGLRLTDSSSKDSKDEEQQSSGGFGSFGTKKNVEEAASSSENKTDDIAKIMGISEFGKSKARTFNINEMVMSAQKTARERNAETNAKLEEENMKMGQQNEEFQHQKKKSDKSAELKEHSKEEESDDDEVIGPPIPSNLVSKISDDRVEARKDSDSDSDDLEDEDDEEEPLVKKIPNSHEISLNHGSKGISALACDHSGTRLISGSLDYDVKFWDFGGMDSSLRSFRSVRPCESHIIRSLQFSATGDKILVVPGSSQAKVLDRDGHNLFECVKGDPYVVDVRRNKGHVGGLTSGCWHPKIKDEFLTASTDGSLRLWLTSANGRNSKNVIKCKSQQGLKATPHCCNYSRDGLLVAAGCQDGSIQMWDHRKSFVNVALLMRDAHQTGTVTSSLVFGYDNRNVVSRGGDDTLKLWDVRNFKKPLNVAKDLFSRFEMTECCFSPDDKMVVTGTSMNRGEESGKLVFFDKMSFDKVLEMDVGNTHVIRTLWHPKLNQIVVGSGDGKLRLFYDLDRSFNGAKLCVVKAPTRAKQSQYISTQQIITPYSLPLFKQERQKSTKKQEEKARKDPVKGHRPDLPLGMRGTGGRVAAGGSTLHSFMAKQISVKNKDDHIDPRERILRHAKESEENPYWITPAYKRTQPRNIFQDSSDGEPSEKMTKSETFG